MIRKKNLSPEVIHKRRKKVKKESTSHMSSPHRDKGGTASDNISRHKKRDCQKGRKSILELIKNRLKRETDNQSHLATSVYRAGRQLAEQEMGRRRGNPSSQLSSDIPTLRRNLKKSQCIPKRPNRDGKQSSHTSPIT